MRSDDRLPPQDIEQEQAALGACIIERQAIVRCIEILRPEDFYRSDHRIIYKTIVEMYDADRGVDLLTLQQELRFRGDLDEVGGSLYLHQLTDQCVSAGNVETYARLVAQACIRRQIIVKAEQAKVLAYEADWPDLVGGNGALSLGATIEERDMSTNRKIRALQAADFLRAVGDPPEKVVAEILPDMQLTAWAGKPKAGKSLFILDMIHSIALGTPVFGYFEVLKPGAVLLIDMENPMHEIANRLLKRGINLGSSDVPLHIVSANFRLDPSGMGTLSALTKAVQPVLVVIDSAREALGITDWNDTAIVTERVRPLRIFAQKVCPVLMVAHNRKAESVDSGDEISGSNAFASALDGWLSVKKTEFHADKRLTHHYEARGRGMLTSFVAEMDPEDLHVHVMTDEEQAKARRKREKEVAAKDMHDRDVRVMDALETSGPSTITELAGITGISDRIVRMAITALQKIGRVRQIDVALREGPGRPAPVFELITDSRIPIDSSDSVINSPHTEEF